MKLYAVIFDTYDECFGAEIYLFGVYDTKEKAAERIRYLRETKSKTMYVPDEGDKYGIKEIVLNADYEEYLGGYTE